MNKGLLLTLIDVTFFQWVTDVTDSNQNVEILFNCLKFLKSEIFNG